MSLNRILDFLPWLICSQGVILAGVILSKWHHRSNRYLGGFVLLLCLHSLTAILWMQPDQGIFWELYIAFSCVPFLYGPIIFRYIWHSLYKDFTDPTPFIVHSIPSLVNFVIYLLVYLIFGREYFLATVDAVFAGAGPLYVRIIEWAKVLQGIIYTIMIIRLLYTHRNALKRLSSSGEHRRWLITILTVFGINWIVVFISAFLLWSQNLPLEKYLPLLTVQLLFFLVFLYTAAFFTLKFPVILDPKEVREEIRKKLNLSEDFIDETLKRLDKAESDRFFTDPEITLTTLSSMLGLHPNELSYIINENKGCNFREYLNSLRVDAFINLAFGEEGNLLDFAFSAGFSSKTTFLRVFRSLHNTTPQEYLSAKGPNSHN